jgi:hypothetical protein
MATNEEAPAGISPIAEITSLIGVLLAIGDPEPEEEPEAGE